MGQNLYVLGGAAPTGAEVLILGTQKIKITIIILENLKMVKNFDISLNLFGNHQRK